MTLRRRGWMAAGAAATIAVVGFVGAGTAEAVRGTQYRPPVETARGGAVATESREASRVARRVLARGGNAVDAAVAATFALGVARPQSCGIGGGGFLVYRSAGGRTDTVDFRETAPAAMRPDTLAGPGPHQAFTGQRTVGVPGTVAGLDAALARYGTLSLADALAPAIALARDGFRVPPALAADTQANAARLARFPASAAIFLPGGRPLAEGARLRQPDLARTLGEVAANGPSAFYSGRFARAVAASMAAAPQRLAGDRGLVTRADLAAYRPVFRRPLRGTYRGREIVAMPPPTSGGVAVLQALNLLEGTDLRAAGPASADALHLVAEAQKVAWADRNAYVADPDQVDQPVRELVSKGYADARRPEIDPTRAKTYAPGRFAGAAARAAGADANPRGSTTHLSVIDPRGSAVSLTCTIEQTYGSAVVAPGTGVLLNNEMTDFSGPGTANAPAPGKRPRSSMSPTLVVERGRTVLAIGGAGGARIVAGVLLGVVNRIDFGLGVADALDAERIDAPGTLSLTVEEGRIPVGVRDELQRRGHRLVPVGQYDSRPRVNAVGFDVATGRRQAATDPRTSADALVSRRPAVGGSTRAADARAPRVVLVALRRGRAGSAAGALRVAWRAADRGRAGVAAASVQVRPRGGTWASAVGATTRSAAHVPLRGLGRRFAVRVRVTDRAGNVSPWAEGRVRRGPGLG